MYLNKDKVKYFLYAVTNDNKCKWEEEFQATEFSADNDDDAMEEMEPRIVQLARMFVKRPVGCTFDDPQDEYDWLLEQISYTVAKQSPGSDHLQVISSHGKYTRETL